MQFVIRFAAQPLRTVCPVTEKAIFGNRESDQSVARFNSANFGLNRPIRSGIPLQWPRGQTGDPQLRQPLGASRSSRAAGPGLIHERVKARLFVGHRWLLASGWCQLPDLAANRRSLPKAVRRYGAV
jgi:hypothetical protein